ncbi:hypothetical protein CDIK_3130 [Cucumispora dikerogammari]|nr:hypothetical protein CDIK_3130 [Cucumispora dikerogammari]
MFIFLIKTNNLFFPLLLNIKTYTLDTSNCFVYCSDKAIIIKSSNKRKQRFPRKAYNRNKAVRNAEAGKKPRGSNTERDSTSLTNPNIYTTNIFTPQTHMSSLSNTTSSINPPIQANRISPLRLPKNLDIKQTNNSKIPTLVEGFECLDYDYQPAKGLSKDNILKPSVIDTDKKVDSSEFGEIFSFKIENVSNVTSDIAKKRFIVYYKKKPIEQDSHETSYNIMNENNKEYTFKIETLGFQKDQGEGSFYIDIFFHGLPVFLEIIKKTKNNNCSIEILGESRNVFSKSQRPIRVSVETDEVDIKTKICDILPSFKLSTEEYFFKNRYAHIIRGWNCPREQEEKISSMQINSIKKTQPGVGKNTKKQEKIVPFKGEKKKRRRIGYFLNTYILSEKDTSLKHEKSIITFKIIKKLYALKEHLKTMHVSRRTEETPRSFLKKKIKEIYFFYQQFFSDSKDIINHTENKDDPEEEMLVAVYKKVYNYCITDSFLNLFISYNEYLRDPNEEKLEERIFK